MTGIIRNGTVLVLGAGGFIGTHLLETLSATGTSTIAATRTPLAKPPRGVRNVVCRFVEAADFTDLLGDCSAVVHAAAHSTPGSSMATPQLDGDLRTTLSLLEALQSHPACRLLFLSSAGTLYGDRTEPAREYDPILPRSYHGAGKAAAEHFIRAWAAQHDGTAVIIRPSNIYGGGQMSRRGFAIVPTAMQCARDAAPLTVYNDGTQIRDYLHIHDLVELCVRALHARIPSGTHVFNAASGVATSLTQLLDMIEAVSGLRVQRHHVASRPADIGSILLDPGAAAHAFGWVANLPLEAGLAETWRWFQSRA